MNPDNFNPFESLNVGTKDKAKNGYDAATLAESCYKVQRAVCNEPNRWNTMAELDREPWLNMAQVGITVFDVRDGEELRISVREWARNLWNVLCQSRGIDFPWDELLPLEQFSWHAIVRHVSNLLDSDGPQSLNCDEAEEKVIGWARDRVDAEKHLEVL